MCYVPHDSTVTDLIPEPTFSFEDTFIAAYADVHNPIVEEPAYNFPKEDTHLCTLSREHGTVHTKTYDRSSIECGYDSLTVAESQRFWLTEEDNVRYLNSDHQTNYPDSNVTAYYIEPY